MPQTKRYFEELDKQAEGRSPESFGMEAILRSKIGGQFQNLVTPENLKKMYMLGRPDAYSYYSGVNARPMIEKGRTPTQVASKITKDFSSALQDGERVPEGKTIIGVGQNANPNTFTHELRHEKSWSFNPEKDELINRFYDLMYGSTSYPAYTSNLRRVYDAAIREDPEFYKGTEDADYARRRKMAWGASDKDREAYILKHPFLKDLLSPAKEDVSLPTIAKNVFSDIVDKNYQINSSRPYIKTEDLPKDAIELRSKFPFLNFVGKVEEPESKKKSTGGTIENTTHDRKII